MDRRIGDTFITMMTSKRTDPFHIVKVRIHARAQRATETAVRIVETQRNARVRWILVRFEVIDGKMCLDRLVLYTTNDNIVALDKIIIDTLLN